MKYYIDKLHYLNPANKKMEQIVEYMSQYNNTIIVGDYKKLASEIDAEIKDLNSRFPRTKRVIMNVIDLSDMSGNILLCVNYDPANSDTSLAQMSLHPIKDTIYLD